MNLKIKTNRENTKLLATIIFTLILAMSFWSIYDVALSEYVEKTIRINLFFQTSFIIGIISLFFLFCTYVKPLDSLLFLSYSFSFLFMLFLILLLTGGFGSSIFRIILELLAIESVIFIFFLTVILGIIYLLCKKRYLRK